MDFPKSVPGVGLVGGRFADEDVQSGRQGSTIPAAWGNAVTLEILSVIEAAGLMPDEESANQLLLAIGRLHGALSADSGMVILATPGVQTWQVPEILRSGKKKARVRGVGGGGGAARRSTASNVAVTGGSGAGGFDVLVDLTGVVTVAVTVGAAGTVGATADSAGTPGGSTSFGAYASAEGGPGGLINGNSPLGGNAYSSLPGALLIRGGASNASVGSPSGSTYGGGGGSSMLGFGGPFSASGSPAFGYGAGAGGSVSSGSPLSTSGVVIIEW